MLSHCVHYDVLKEKHYIAVVNQASLYELVLDNVSACWHQKCFYLWNNFIVLIDKEKKQAGVNFTNIF